MGTKHREREGEMGTNNYVATLGESHVTHGWSKGSQLDRGGRLG
jgi:hypothetical protein